MPVLQKHPNVVRKLFWHNRKLSRPNLINSKTVFIWTLIVLPTLSLLIYLTGIRNHRTLYFNSLISTTILSVVFFSFITIGLYNGWKLRDSYGNFLDKFNSAKCKGDLLKSAGKALLFTFLYNCWIYAIILGTHYLHR